VALAITRQGSHRPASARIRAYGSSDDGFAIQLHAECPDCYLWHTQETAEIRPNAPPGSSLS